jgi:hypothetical protein
MTTDRIKELLVAKPFKPFEIHVADGDVLEVKHPELMWVTPGGRTIFVARGPKEEDGIAILDLLLVTKLIVGNSRRNGRKRS